MSRTPITYATVSRSCDDEDSWALKEPVFRSHSGHSTSSGSRSSSSAGTDGRETGNVDSGVENETTSLSPKVSDVSGGELSSESSSYLNEEFLLASKPSPVPSGDSGQASWQAKLDSRVGVNNMVSTIPPEKAMDLEFGPLSYGVPQGRKKGVKKILHEVHGRFRPGTLSAIMGPSGAGKTCLLNVLAGYKSSNVKGEILINGNPRDLRKFRKQSSYIMQDDCVFGNLTVSETLLFAAELKCGPARSSQKDRKLLVADIMETLGMAACATTMARSLSGGERKRLCIAIELINNPPIMFFDEPTSGLDSQTCFQFISLLSALAAAGRTIICTIHQPSMRLLEMFQHLMVMANGRCIYRGNVPNMVPYLATKGLICPPYHNPADFVMEIVLGEASKPVVKSLVEGANNGKCEDWDNSDIDISPPSYSSRQESSDESSTDIDVIGKSERAPTLIIDDAQCWSKEETSIKEPLTDSTNDHYDIFSASYPRQLWVLMKRAFLLIVRDRILLYTRFAAHLFVGLIMGMMFYGVGNDADNAWSNASSLFFNLIVLIFAAMMATILTFPMELPVVIREHMNSWYSLKMYFLAQTLLDLPFQIFFAGIYHSMTYFMTGQPLELERFFLTLAVAVLVSITAQNVGVMVGAFVEIQAGVFLGPLFTIPVMLFCGFFISVEKMPYFLQWMPWISYLRYAYEAVFAATYGMEREDLDCFNPYCHFKDPETFLDFLDLPNVQYWPNLFVLAGLATLFRALAYFFVRRKVRSGR